MKTICYTIVCGLASDSSRRGYESFTVETFRTALNLFDTLCAGSKATGLYDEIDLVEEVENQEEHCGGERSVLHYESFGCNELKQPRYWELMGELCQDKEEV